MSLFGNLYVGNSGLQTHQNALNTTAHNMSNADTKGYVRQQALFATSPYNTLSVNYKAVANQQIGFGVTYAAARQVRDTFLDKAYRKESGRSAFYQASSSAIEEVETVLGELNGVAFKNSMDDLWTSVQELSKVPDNQVNQKMFVQRSAAFLQRAQSVYKGLCEYQDNLNNDVRKTVDKINNYGNQIRTLNDKIRAIECGGIERANDLRDVRNQLVDELSGMGTLDYWEDADGSVIIKFEGVPFVDRDVVYEMDVKQDGTTGFYTPFWPQNTPFTYNADGSRNYDISENGQVFNLKQEISSDNDTDIGSLKAALLARGDRRGNYTDLLNKDHYIENVKESTIVNVQAQFDQLIHGVVTRINEVLAEASDKVKGGYLSNEDGSPIQMFLRANGTGWDTPEDVSPGKEDTLFSINNIVINQDLVQEPTKLSFIKDKKVDYETAEKLKNLFKEQNYSLNPTVVEKSNLLDYYSNLVSQVGNSGYVYRSMVKSQQQTVQIIENARQEVIGVSTDEELANMIRFQNGYNAATRYINAVSEMLEHLINKLG